MDEESGGVFEQLCLRWFERVEVVGVGVGGARSRERRKALGAYLI